MNVATRTPRTLVLLLAGLFLTQLASAQTTFNWTSGSGIDTNWSTIANWDNGAATPGSLDTAIFGAAATVGNATTINNVVDTSATVATLRYTNSITGQWHVTQIPAATTLTVSGALTAGGITADALTNLTAITGEGTLVVNGSVTVGEIGATAANSSSMLDLSGLSNFVFNNSAGNLQVGNGARSGADMKFAAVSNNVTAANVNFDNASISSAPKNATVTLGSGTNIFNVANIFVTAWSRNTCTLQFPGATGGLRLRGPSGADADPCPTYQVGFRANFNSTGGGSSAGTNNFFGHPVDMLINQLTVGRESVGGQTVGGNVSTGTGVLNFGPGTIKVLTEIEIGRATSQGPQANGVGILNISGGTLIYAGTGANSSSAGFNLGYDTGTATTAGTSTAFLNVTNGSVISSNSILRQYATGFGNGSSFINLIRSSMTVAGGGLIGLPAVPINTLTIGDSTLSLAIPLGSTNVSVTTLNNVSTTNNTINILSFPTILNYPTTYRLIKYASGTPGSFVLGSVPANLPAFKGYLSNNVVNNSIDFVLTNGPAPAVQTLVWNGNVSGNWDTTTANWTGGAVYNQNDYVTFNDSASGSTTVNLTTTLTPGAGSGLIVSNFAKLYTFSGAGNIGGPTSVAKSGTNTLVFANGTNNNFSGGLNINGGRVQLTNLDNLLPTSGAVSLANTAGVSVDLNNYNQSIGALTGGGASGGNVTLGASGTNTLTVNGGGNYFGVISGNGAVNKPGGATETFYGANTYTGGTTISSSILAVANSSGSATGPGPITIGAGGFLQIGDGFTSGSVATAIITNNGGVSFNTPNNLTFTNQITGAGTVNQNANNTTTLPTANPGLTGIININSGTLLSTDSGALGNPGNVVIANSGSSCLAVANNLNLNVPIQMYCKGSGNGPSLLNVSGTNTLPGGVFLSEGGQNWVLSSASGRLILSGNWFNGVTSGSRTMWLTGSGDGEFNSNLGNGSGGASTSLLKDGSGTWTLSGNYTYTDTTTVSNGTLLVNGTIPSSSSIRVRGGTLGGTGGTLAPVTVSSGGTLSPGVGIGTLTVFNDLTLAGTTVMELSKVGNVITSDLVDGVGVLTEGGTLTVTLTGAVAGGDVFTLFNASAYVGSFSATNLPALPAGLSWDASNLSVNGTLAVVGPPTLNTSQSGNVLTFSWTGSFKLQSQTNALNVGIQTGNANWFDYPGGASSPVSTTIDPANPSVFFRLISP